MKRSNHRSTASPKRRPAHLIAALATALTCTAPVYASAQKLSAELRGRSGSEQVEVIVQYRTAPTEAHHHRVANLGGQLHSSMEYVHAAHYSVPVSAVNDLSDDPDVVYISPNRPVRQMMDIPAESVNAAAAVTAKLDGSGIGVAVIDSGIGLSSNFNH